jgi:hypothetical protein
MASFFQLSVAAQIKPTVSGAAATTGDCSPSSVGIDVKNQPGCIFITNIYKITKVYQNSRSFKLSQAELDLIVDEVARRVLAEMKGPFLDLLNAELANRSEETAKAQIPSSTADAPVPSDQKSADNATSAPPATKQTVADNDTSQTKEPEPATQSSGIETPNLLPSQANSLRDLYTTPSVIQISSIYQFSPTSSSPLGSPFPTTVQSLTDQTPATAMPSYASYASSVANPAYANYDLTSTIPSPANPASATAIPWYASSALTAVNPPYTTLGLTNAIPSFADSPGIIDQITHTSLEAETQIRIDAEGLRTSIVGMLSNPNSIYLSNPNASSAGLLHFGSDGSIEITATSTGLYATSIQFSSPNDVLAGQASVLIDSKGNFSSASTTLQIGADGGLKLDGLPLKAEATPCIDGATQPCSLAGTFGNPGAWAAQLTQPQADHWVIHSGNGASVESAPSEQNGCNPWAKIQVTVDGHVRTCAPAFDSNSNPQNNQ